MRKKMPETEYRASRVCRILGNPTAYQVIKILFRSAKTPTELAAELGLSITTISEVLKNLRNIDVVRYEVKATERTYWIKHDPLIEILLKLEKLVKRIRIQKW
jgi:transcription initiation factor IIE alpha subunit